jgi:hypothetical protein
VRAVEPGEFGSDELGWAPHGVTQVEVQQWCDPMDGAVLLELRTALPPAGHGRTLCIAEARTPEAARAAVLMMPSTNALGTHITDDGAIYPMWAYTVDVPTA